MSISRKLGFIRHGAILFGVFLLLTTVVSAQNSTGSISGVVQDESGAVVPAAEVTVTNADTGIARTVPTDTAGRYTVPGLIPDHYEIQVRMSGFETAVRTGIQLTVGSSLEINMTLRVGQVTEKTVVTAEAPLIETLSGTVSGLVDDKAIRDLPLNARSFDQLITLESSAPIIRYTANAGLTNGSYYNYTVNGARGMTNIFLMDGTELMGAGSITTLPGGATGYNLGVDAIREFTVLTSSYDAAYGKRQGGVINMATRSGTNQWHGSAFEFLRNSDLDARNFFDLANAPAPSPLPPFRRNQFGGSLGGPIRKDRAFFFVNYEGLRSSLGESLVDFVPDNAARQGILPVGSGGSPVNIGVAPSVQPYMILFPPANGPDLGQGVAKSFLNPNEITSQDFYLGRFDYKISDKDSFFARYNYSPGSENLVSNVLQTGSVIDSTAQVLTLEETRAYATTLNTIRLGYSRATIITDTPLTQPVPASLDFIPGAKSVGELLFSSGLNGTGTGTQVLTLEGTNTTTDRFFNLNQYDVSDQVFHQLGAHGLKFGVQIQRFQSNGDFGVNKWGLFQFPTFEQFLQGAPSAFEGPAPGSSGAYKAYRQTYIGTYIQDDYKLRSNLTLNLGLRYEFMTPPTEVNNRISNFSPVDVNGIPTLPTNPTLGSPFYQSNKLNFAPRLGFAWDIFGDGKTAVRGGFGMFYDQITSEYRFYTAQDVPYYDFVTVTNPPFPLGFSGTKPGQAAGLPQADGINFNLSVPTELQYNLNIQRQLTSSTAFTIGYIGTHSYHLTDLRDDNTTAPTFLPNGQPLFPTGGPRINPQLSTSRIVYSDATSEYNGLSMDFVERFSHGLRSKVSFTWAKSIDNASGVISLQDEGDSSQLENPFNPAMDRGLSAFDVGRNLVVNLTYDLPGNNFTGVEGKVLGGWQVSSIVTLSDGMPFTVLTGFNQSKDAAYTTSDRPNFVAGAVTNLILGGPNQYYNPNAYALPPVGTFGDMGRNTLIGPGFNNVDFTLVKETKIGERLKADFRAEFFNILNRTNFGLPLNSVFNSNGSIKATSGQVSATVTDNREIQFGMKLIF